MTNSDKFINIAVCGAHMTGLPLNPQLTSLGGVFVQVTSTSPDYRLYKLNGFTPARPGLLRVNKNGASVNLEVWRLPLQNYGAFVAGVPAPLGFGTLTLVDGRNVQGFLCEHYATLNAIDISSCGGWRNYLENAA